MCDYAALDAALHNIEKKKKKNSVKCQSVSATVAPIRMSNGASLNL